MSSGRDTGGWPQALSLSISLGGLLLFFSAVVIGAQWVRAYEIAGHEAVNAAWKLGPGIVAIVGQQIIWPAALITLGFLVSMGFARKLLMQLAVFRLRPQSRITESLVELSGLQALLFGFAYFSWPVPTSAVSPPLLYVVAVGAAYFAVYAPRCVLQIHRSRFLPWDPDWEAFKGGIAGLLFSAFIIAGLYAIFVADPGLDRVAVGKGKERIVGYRLSEGKGEITMIVPQRGVTIEERK